MISANTPIGKITTTIQALSVNLKIAKTSTTRVEAMQAAPLMASLRVRCSSERFRWYLNMPAEAITKPVNTPMA